MRGANSQVAGRAINVSGPFPGNSQISRTAREKELGDDEGTKVVKGLLSGGRETSLTIEASFVRLLRVALWLRRGFVARKFRKQKMRC